MLEVWDYVVKAYIEKEVVEKLRDDMESGVGFVEDCEILVEEGAGRETKLWEYGASTRLAE